MAAHHILEVVLCAVVGSADVDHEWRSPCWRWCLPLAIARLDWASDRWNPLACTTRSPAVADNYTGIRRSKPTERDCQHRSPGSTSPDPAPPSSGRVPCRAMSFWTVECTWRTAPVDSGWSHRHRLRSLEQNSVGWSLGCIVWQPVQELHRWAWCGCGLPSLWATFSPILRVEFCHHKIWRWRRLVSADECEGQDLVLVSQRRWETPSPVGCLAERWGNALVQWRCWRRWLSFVVVLVYVERLHWMWWRWRPARRGDSFVQCVVGWSEHRSGWRWSRLHSLWHSMSIWNFSLP